MKNLFIFISISFYMFLLPTSCSTRAESTIFQKTKSQKSISGKVIKIADGDTFTMILEHDNFNVRVRLNEIDCPEKKQPFSKKAKQHLSKLIFGKKVTVYYKKKDRYGRVLGTVFIDNTNINNDMVKSGFAWHFKKYSDSKELAELENEARRQRIGLWYYDNPISPWEWRKMKRKK